MHAGYLLALLVLFPTLLVLRGIYLLFKRPSNVKKLNECHLAVFLGSGLPLYLRLVSALIIALALGGHTAEMIRLLVQLDPERYSKRTYMVSSGDNFSRAKALELERFYASGDV